MCSDFFRSLNSGKIEELAKRIMPETYRKNYEESFRAALLQLKKAQ